MVALLKERGECNTREIYHHLNRNTKWGATMNQVGNIMSKDLRFEKVDRTERIGAVISGSYPVCIWRLSGADHD